MTRSTIFGTVAAIALTVTIVCLPSVAAGQKAGAHYDESKVPEYTLPDPLVGADGAKITDAKAWHQTRRPEILELFRNEVYGHSPDRPDNLRFVVESCDREALGGRATRKQVTIYFGDRDAPKIDMLIYLPNDAPRPVPAFMGLNFNGNQSVDAGSAIQRATVWNRDAETGRTVAQQANEKSRGTGRRSWPVETIVDRGYALATACYHDIFPDSKGGLPDSVEPLYFKPGQTDREANAWGAIGAWAWGLSRMLDYLETDADVDAIRVAVMGHSRLGKTALWAGAQDPRFVLVISNDSGCGGAALSRRAFGETVAIINNSFPHWFALNFRKYGGHEADLPVDQHMLISLIAPRPVYVASAEEDQWADPRGKFLSLKAAEPVYLMLGTDGLGVDEMPEVGRPVARTMGYHVRPGRHGVTPFDWQQYLDFADRHLRK